MTDMFETLLATLGSPEQQALMDWNQQIEPCFLSGKASFIATFESIRAASCQLVEELLKDDVSEDIIEVLYRTTKTVLRWQVQFMPAPEEPSALMTLDMLRLYVGAASSETYTQDTIRFSLLCLLYSTLERKESCHYLLHDLNFMERVFIPILTSNESTIEVLVAQARLLHNLVVTMVMKKDIFVDLSLSIAEGDDAPLWAETDESDDSSSITLLKALIRQLQWSLEQDIIQIDNPRPVQLANELLHIFYAIQVDTISSSLMTKLLQHDHLQNGAVMILMNDTSTSPPDGWKLLLYDILARQLGSIEKPGPLSVSDLSPILVVLHQYCQRDANFLNDTQHLVFPNAPVPNIRSNKMLPADAPEGSLRYNLISLLSQPSMLKRLAGELLFLLSEEKPKLYMQRVGLGNAMPLLQAKGLIEIE